MILCSNPKLQYLAHKEEIDIAIQSVLAKGNLVMGENVEAFEKEFSTFIGAKYTIGVGSGTDAICLALRALEINDGDEIIVPSHTATASVAAIVLAGAVPVFAEVESEYFTLDPISVEKAITPKSKGVLVVHLYGQPADMDGFRKVAKKYNLKLIEDCAQSPGASYKGTRVGTLGEVGCFSFYPTKNLGALGDGGAVTTSDCKLAERLIKLRQYGWDKDRISQYTGYNSRLDEIQAAVLRVKLRYLEEDNANRISIANQYEEQLNSLPLVLPKRRPECLHVYHLFVIDVEQRNALESNLKSKGVIAGIHYPVPVHLMPAFKGYSSQGLIHTEKIVDRVLSLPIYPELSHEDQSLVINHLKEFFDK
ncbi:MAG: DegT/DnrJ/EryC1/StrS family aminotransferase [Nitrospinota bacterium]